jgi:hypothetical protein
MHRRCLPHFVRQRLSVASGLIVARSFDMQPGIAGQVSPVRKRVQNTGQRGPLVQVHLRSHAFAGISRAQLQ